MTVWLKKHSSRFIFGLVWLVPILAGCQTRTSSLDAPAAASELMRGETRAGAGCLEGEVADCRRWLGLDRDSLSRYRPEELRHQIFAGRYFADATGARLAQQCQAGLDASCLRLAWLRYLEPIPAGPLARSSLVGFVRARTAAGALGRAFDDDSGSVGERLARASGVTEDSLVRAWRIWLLTGGGQPRVTASLRDAWPELLFAGLLVLVASRNGRWR